MRHLEATIITHFAEPGDHPILAMSGSAKPGGRTGRIATNGLGASLGDAIRHIARNATEPNERDRAA